MKAFLYPMFATILITLGGCPGGKSLGPNRPHYISEYLSPGQAIGGLEFNPEEMKLIVYEDQFRGKIWRSDGADSSGLYYKDVEDRHEEIAESIGDTSFNKDSGETYHFPTFADTVQEIHIYSSPSFRGQDSTSTILDDKVNIHYEWPFVYVQNGYKNKSDITKDETLISFNESSKPFMSAWFAGFVQSSPQQSGNYTFTATITFTNGKEFEFISEPVYLEGEQ